MTNLDKHFDAFLDACDVSDISMSFLVPFLIDKNEALILDAIKHLNKYAKSIPDDSLLAERINMRRKNMCAVKPLSITQPVKATRVAQAYAVLQDITDHLCELGTKEDGLYNQALELYPKCPDNITRIIDGQIEPITNRQDLIDYAEKQAMYCGKKKATTWLNQRLEAFDKREIDLQKIDDEIGLTEASKRWDRAMGYRQQLIKAILAVPISTLDDMRIKLKVYSDFRIEDQKYTYVKMIQESISA